MALGGNRNKEAMSEINVTPLVDVMLVLLVIFMITAPLMLNGIKLQLPKTKETNPLNLTTRQVVLSLTRSEELFLGKDKISKNDLIKRIGLQFKESKTDMLFLRADFGIRYGQVAKLMSFLKRGGISNIALVTETEK